MLNKLQQKAVDNPSLTKAIIAGAGTGKTHTLVSIIEADIIRGFDPSCMVAITFTRNASSELKERLELRIGESAQDIFANTIHGLCLEIINQFISRTGFKENFNIYDRDDRKDIMKSVIKYLELKKVKYEDVEHYATTGEMRTMFERMVYDEYMERMQKYNAIDLSMIIPMAIDLLHDPEVVEVMSEQMKHFYIDEFQDTNDTQLLILNMLKRESLVVIGDPDQSIYEWNGAKPENMMHMEWLFDGIQKFILEDNYRSTEQIISVANNLIRNNETRIEKKLVAHKTGQDVTLIGLHNVKAQLDKIAKNITGKLNENAVICRTNAHAEYIYNGLMEKGIECNLITSSSDPFRTKSAKDLIKLLALINNIEDNYSARRVGQWLLGISDKSITRIDSKSGHNTLLEGLRDYTKAGAELFPKIRSMQNHKEVMLTYDFIMMAIEKTGVLKFYSDRDRISKLIEIDNFRKEVRRWETRQKYFGGRRLFSDFMKYIQLRDIQENYKQDKEMVYIMTVHGSKGLEFPYVHIPYLNEKMFPIIRGSMPNIQEERRAMYVAVTRAEKGLYLYRPETFETRNFITLNGVPSRFLSEMGF